MYEPMTLIQIADFCGRNGVDIDNCRSVADLLEAIEQQLVIEYRSDPTIEELFIIVKDRDGYFYKITGSEDSFGSGIEFYDYNTMTRVQGVTKTITVWE